MRHFHTYHQSLNFYTFWRNPHLLVCFLPEMAFFALTYIFPFTGRKKFASCYMWNTGCNFSRTCVGRCVCVLCAPPLVPLDFRMPPLQLTVKLFPPLLTFPSRIKPFPNASIRIQDQFFSANARITIHDKTFAEVLFLCFCRP